MTVREGIRAVKLDPMLCATALGMATERIGVGVTYSTTYYEPFHVARVFATLDQLTGGRAAWNVVTSLNRSEAANFGHEAVLEHDLRYDRAEEFLEVVRGHWRSWDEDALVLGPCGGRVCRPGQGAADRASGYLVQVAGTVHGAALGAGGSRC